MATLRRVTIFGGAGFIGRYIVKRLGARGAVVTVVGRNARAASYLTPMGDVGQIALINADLSDEVTVAAAIEGADTVINLVGILAETGKQRFEDVQHKAAGRIAALSKSLGVKRLLQVSAIGADPNAASRYARTKGLGEAAVRSAFPEAIVLRPSIVFGPEDKFFNRFATLAQISPALPLIGGGHTKFQPVYVGDVADAALVALDHPEAAGETYELGGPKVYTFKELMALTLDLIQRKRWLVDLPIPLATRQAALLEKLPGALLTRDQVTLLQQDNVVSPGAPGFADLGITPAAVELIVPTYLDRYRRGGWYTRKRMA
ncbi:MAG TPA: complex I NDUFA9 subunit family protein [Stellaceae bacterium]|nr:complex I NDUFA9 subunit family protein [Stellaceae bacterium]